MTLMKMTALPLGLVLAAVLGTGTGLAPLYAGTELQTPLQSPLAGLGLVGGLPLRLSGDGVPPPRAEG